MVLHDGFSALFQGDCAPVVTEPLPGSEDLLERGVYVSGFGFPVVPQGQARLRAQISAAHTREDLEFAVEKFKKTGKELGII